MQKLNARKSMRIINGNAVRGRLSKNYRMKYFGHEIFAIYGNFYACYMHSAHVETGWSI